MFNTVRKLFTKHIYTRKDFPKWNFKSQSNTDLQLTILLSTRDSGNRSTLRYMSFLAVLHVIQNVSNCKICKQNVSHFCLSDWVINPLSPHFQTYQAVKEGAKVYNKSDSKATEVLLKSLPNGITLQKFLQVACENVRRDSTPEVESLESAEFWPVGLSHALIFENFFLADTDWCPGNARIVGTGSPRNNDTVNRKPGYTTCAFYFFMT